MADAAADRGAEDFFPRAVDFVGRVLLPSGLFVGILYYFGFIRERALFGYFGVPLEVVDYTTTDYLVRSAEIVFAPLTTILVLGLIVFLAHQLLLIRLRNHRWWRAGWAVGGAVALTLLALGLIGIHRPRLALGPVNASLALGVGAVLLDYVAWMMTVSDTVPPSASVALERTRIARHVLLLGLAVIAAFWWTLNSANSNGLQTARAIEGSLDGRGEAIVLSDQRLAIGGHGVQVEVLTHDAKGPAFRYTGLRVLAHSADQWLLVPVGWTHVNGDATFLLSDHAEGFRVDVRP